MYSTVLVSFVWMRGVLRVQYYTFLIVLFNFLCIFNEGPYFPIVMNPRPPPPPPWKSFWCLFWATDCCAYPLVSHSYSVFRRGHPQPQKKTVSSPLHAKKTRLLKVLYFHFSPRIEAKKYILLVAVIVLTLEIPRFHHFELTRNNTDFWTTELMENPKYIKFRGYWWELRRQLCFRCFCTLHHLWVEKVYWEIES